MIRIGVNGFGRIGRAVTRLSHNNPHFQVVAINDLADKNYLAYALKHDSLHGLAPFDVTATENGMKIGDREVTVFAQPKPDEIPWKAAGVDFVLESTGRFRKIPEVSLHLKAGAKKVFVAVPLKDELKETVVLGVNDDVITPESQIISNASCTTNCSAPLVKILHEAFGVTSGLLTTVHAYTADQRLVDAAHKDFRRSRSAAINMIPTTTGAATTLGKVYPAMKGLFTGFAVRVPVADGSLIDLTMNVSKDITIEDVHQAVRERANSDLKGIVEYSEAPLVSSDIVGNPHSCIYDSEFTQVMGGRLLKVIAWYDNEMGYANRMVDLISKVAQISGQ